MMKKTFRVGQSYRCEAPCSDNKNKSYGMKVVSRTENTVSFVYDELTASALHVNSDEVITKNIITNHQEIAEDIFPLLDIAEEIVVAYDTDNAYVEYFHATELDENAIKRRKYILSNWKAYGIAESEEEMKKILNILEAHDETLDSMHDASMGNRDECCGIFFEPGEDDRTVVKVLYDFNIFYPSLEEMRKAYEELTEDTDETVAEFVESEDIRKTTDGYVRVLHY